MKRIVLTISIALLSTVSFSQNFVNFFENETNRSQSVNRNPRRNVAQQRQTNISQSTNRGSQQNNSQRYNLNVNDDNRGNNEEQTNYVDGNLNNQRAAQTNISRGNLNNQKVVQTNKAPANVMNFVQSGIQTTNVNRGNQRIIPVNDNNINVDINPVQQTNRVQVQRQQNFQINDEPANPAEKIVNFQLNNGNNEVNDLQLTADLSLGLQLNIKPLNIDLNLSKPDIKPLNIDLSLDKPTMPKLNFSNEAKTSSTKKKKSNRHSYYSQDEKKYTGKKIKNWAKKHLKIAKTFRASVMCPEF